jgi:hypothetical protein
MSVGIVVVVVLVAAFTLVFLQRQSHVVSTSASISSESYDVGTDYSGYVTKQFVHVGDTVTKGQPLFTISSLSVLSFVSSKVKAFNSSAYTVTTDGTMTFLSPITGTVSAVRASVDGFVDGGSLLATVDKTGSLFVSSSYSITPRDYQRIDDGAAVDVTLPNDQVIHGKVQTVSVQTVDGVAKTEIKVESAGLVDGSHSGLVSPGTPVTATLHLRQDRAVSGIQSTFSSVLARVGL